MSSFFTLPGSAKRKRTDAQGNSSKKVRPAATSARKSRRPTDDDDEISSDSEAENAAPRGSDDESDDELKTETATEKRLRLAQQYLDNIRKEVGMWWECYGVVVVAVALANSIVRRRRRIRCR